MCRVHAAPGMVTSLVAANNRGRPQPAALAGCAFFEADRLLSALRFLEGMPQVRAQGHQGLAGATVPHGCRAPAASLQRLWPWPAERAPPQAGLLGGLRRRRHRLRPRAVELHGRPPAGEPRAAAAAAGGAWLRAPWAFRRTSGGVDVGLRGRIQPAIRPRGFPVSLHRRCATAASWVCRPWRWSWRWLRAWAAAPLPSP